MMISLHNLAKEYSVLPSEALSRASTFDFQVLNIATHWEQKKYNDQNNPEGAKKTVAMPSQEEMLAMVKKSKEKK